MTLDAKLANTVWAEQLFIAELFSVFKAPDRMTTRQWAEANRFLTSEVTSRPGKMDCSVTPWMLYVMECLDDPYIPIIIGKKSAQIAWTETINNWVGKNIDLEARNMAIAFARDASRKAYYKEKLEPFIKSTPCLSKKIGNLKKIDHKHIPFPGGFLKLVNLGSASEAKSSVVPYLIVEEPDDIKGDVSNQGDGIALLEERKKSFSDGKIVFAGTPTDAEFSQVDIAYEYSNKMQYMVFCHKCGEPHSLNFDNLHCDPYPARYISKLYGRNNPESAMYICPRCGAPWPFDVKNKAVSEAINYFNLGWDITRPEEKSIYGFAFNELLSSFAASDYVNLAKKRCKAEVAYENGQEGLMKAFTNNQMGLAYSPKINNMGVEELIARRLNYAETVVPYEGLVLTAGIDVQKNRFAIVVRAWGRNNNSWLVQWVEIFGDTEDWEDKVWVNLTNLMLSEWKHVSGKKMRISSIAIDSGWNTELVYRWVLQMSTVHKHNHVFATKGLDDTKETRYEIFNEPGAIEVTSDSSIRKTLSQTMGVNVYIIGAHKAHAEVLRRFRLQGNHDRFYHCASDYPNYEDGILSCRQAYSASGHDGQFKLMPNKRKEAIDCEKMNLFVSYAIQIRNYTTVQWTALENYYQI